MSDARKRMKKRLVNALTLWRRGRLTPPYRAPFEVVLEDAHVALRAYHAFAPDTHAHAQAPTRAVLLVPPLMVTSEIYDIAPDLSAVAYLTRAGTPTYVADFGAPEAREGGLDRTLDDHVLAVSRCIDHLRELTGHDVHLVGYSQGGMFCYQTAAYRKGLGIASLVTFGSPVDIRRNMPFKLDERIAEPVIAAVRRVIDRPLEGLRGLSGAMSSRGFKLMAPVQELRHLVQLASVLHDEEALARVEPKRRFLGGEGFIAWPGPALRTFIDEFVVGNRMKRGGFVIAGRTTALADIACPICYVIGEDDDFATPDAVRAIKSAAPRAATYPVHVAAGHFGLVVGRAALATCWPTVVAWTRWHDGLGPRPEVLDTAREASPAEPQEGARARVSDAAGALWDRLGALGVRLGKVSDQLRWQLPRVARRGLIGLGLGGDTLGQARISLSRELRERAAELPDAVAFVFAGRAFSFGDAERRVAALAQALARAGVGVGRRVGLVTGANPDALGLFVALNRLGAVAVPLVNARGDVSAALARADVSLVVEDVGALVADAERATREPAAREGAGDGAHDAGRDVGRIGDLALVLVDPAEGDAPPRELDNRAWATLGLDLAIDARLTVADTLYVPESASAAMLVAALAGALAGGARLQLGGAGRGWSELLNSGATVVLADDELARALADATPPARHPVRLVLGHHLASEIAAALVDRLGARTRYRVLPL